MMARMKLSDCVIQPTLIELPDAESAYVLEKYRRLPLRDGVVVSLEGCVVRREGRFVWASGEVTATWHCAS